MENTTQTHGKRALRKAPYQRCIRVNITLPPALYQDLEDLMKKNAFGGPSEYVQARIRKDAGRELAA